MKEFIKSGCRILLCYFVFTFICGIFRVESLLTHVDHDVLSMARLSSYINLVISEILAMVFIVALLSGCYFILALLKNAPEKAAYIMSTKVFITIYALNEFAKSVVVILTLKSGNPYTISSADDVTSIFQENNLFYLSYIIDFITFICASIGFNLLLYIKSKKRNIVDTIIVILFLITVFAFTHRDFITIL